MKTAEKPIYEQLAEKIIDQLERGTAPWVKEWEFGLADSNMPYNPTTGKPYRGLNSVWLMVQGYSDPRFMTFNQAKAQGYSVMKGAKSTPVTYFSKTRQVALKGPDGKPLKGPDGKTVKKTIVLDSPVLFSARVFNAEQIDGIPSLKLAGKASWDPIERVSDIVERSGAKVLHNRGDNAYYHPLSDRIVMPEKSQFKSSGSFYATLLHELGHWTGHPSRLDRPIMGGFGSQAYAKEELRAEIGSMMLGRELAIGHDPGNHHAYIKSWISILRDDPFEVYRACSDAQKIHDFVMSFDRGLDLSVSNEQASYSLQGEKCSLYKLPKGQEDTVGLVVRGENSGLYKLDKVSFLKYVQQGFFTREENVGKTGKVDGKMRPGEKKVTGGKPKKFPWENGEGDGERLKKGRGR